MSSATMSSRPSGTASSSPPLVLAEDEPDVAATQAGAAIAMPGSAGPDADLVPAARPLAGGGDEAPDSRDGPPALAVERLGAGAAAPSGFWAG